MKKRVSMLLLLAIACAIAVLVAACGGEAAPTETPGSESKAPATGEPIRVAVTEGFTGFMAMDAKHIVDGVSLALAEVDYQVGGRPIELIKGDNGSDPVKAVDVARRLVENDKVSVIIGPVFPPSIAAVTGYLKKLDNPIPQITTQGQPLVNAKESGYIAFTPAGLFSMQGYMLGKYVVEELGYKTAHAISLDDTGGRELFAGFEKAFTEGGGKILSSQYAPMDNVDWAGYLTELKKTPADCTYYWVFGSDIQFLQQYHDYGIKAPLVTSMASNTPDYKLKELGDLALGVVGLDHYTRTLDTDINKKFVEEFRAANKGEYPAATEHSAYLAAKLWLTAVEQNNGDPDPKKVMEIMSTLSIDSPGGPVQMGPYLETFIGTKNLYVMEVQKLDDEYAWVPIKTYEKVLMKSAVGE